MASKSQTWRRLAHAAHGSSKTYAKADISLSKVGQSAAPSWGAGGNTNHVPSTYLGNLVVISGSLPSSAGEDIIAAHGCTYFGSAYSMAPGAGRRLPPELEQEPTFVAEQWVGTTVPGYATKWVEWLAANSPRDTHKINGRVIDFDESWLRIDFAPFAATMSWRFTDNVVLTDYFISQDELDARRHLAPEEAARQMSRVRRSALVSASLLLTAAELLADGGSGNGRKLPFPEPEEASASASSENEKAPALPRTGASTRHKALPHATATA